MNWARALFILLLVGVLQLFVMELSSKNGGLLSMVKREIR